MKILYHHRIRSKDGQYVHVEELTGALKELGHELIMVAPSATENDSFGSDGGFISRLKTHLPQCLYEILELLYSVKVYFRLAAAIKKHKPDVIYERYNLYLPAGIWAKKKFKLPLLSEINAPIFEERSKYDGIALKSLARWSQRYVWCNADVCLPVTEVLAGYVRKVGVPDSRIGVIHNGINEKRFANRLDKSAAKQQLGIDPTNTVLGFVGFVRDWHGLDLVINMLAAAKDPNRTLLVVGDGPVIEQLTQQAKRLGVAEQVHFTGLVQRDELANYLAAFDIALQPAVVEYASPLKMFEYMAMKAAIVAPDSANIREILSHEESGLLFEPGNIEQMTNYIDQLCKDETLRASIGSAAYQTIKERGFTWLSNAEKVIRLADDLRARRDTNPSNALNSFASK